MKKQFHTALKLGCLTTVLAFPLAAHADQTTYAGSTTSTTGNYDNWRGFYAGGHVGGIFGDFVGHGTTGPGGTGFNAMGGVQGGYNFQYGPWVYGGEVDTAWTSMEGSGAALGHYQEYWTSTFRGRTGYAIGHFLPYVTAGLGMTDTGFAPPSGGVRDDTQLGLAVGGGLEAMTPYKNTSVKLEYLHVDVPNDTNNIGGTTYNGGSSNNIVTVGFNWHFN